MSTLTLTKHHGLGNDFLVVFHPEVDDLPALVNQRTATRPAWCCSMPTEAAPR
jgi:hypothetical protein